MNVISSESFDRNETNYQGFNVEIGKEIWSVCVSRGKYNQVRVSKVKPNPFRGLGKTFDSFKDAYENYKSSKMKNMLNEVQFQYEISNNVTVA